MPRLCPACRAPALVRACHACLPAIGVRLGALRHHGTVGSGPWAPRARGAPAGAARRAFAGLGALPVAVAACGPFLACSLQPAL